MEILIFAFLSGALFMGSALESVRKGKADWWGYIMAIGNLIMAINAFVRL